MKQLLKYLPILALVCAFADSSRADESKRGFYEGDLPGAGKVVFFVQGNHAISAYYFDVSGHQSGFAGGGVGDDGKFTLTTNTQTTITGTISPDSITATFGSQTITATRVSVFGNTDDIAGRFSAQATSSAGEFETRILIDSQNRIFLLGKHGTTTIGGFGTITITSTSPSPSPSPDASPSPSASVSPSVSPSPSASVSPSVNPSPSASVSPSVGPSPSASVSPSVSPSPTPEEEEEDADENEDKNEDANSQSIHATFTLTLVTGEVVTGQLTFNHGVIVGSFPLNGVVYQFRAPQESSENHLANISTRGFVNTGQGQLIGGFIVTGGPKLVAIRALGPSLTAAGVSPVLANPRLELFQNVNGQQVPLKDNDDWQMNSNSAEIVKSTLAPRETKEAALLIRLEPGLYTTVVTGADGGTGIALVEVYEIDLD